MPNYRRAFIPNGYWFFTHNLLDRRQTLLVDHIEALRSAFEETQRKYPFEIVAAVVLPDHLHAVWALPPEDADFFDPLEADKNSVCEILAEAREDIHGA
jgi:putative transposase